MPDPSSSMSPVAMLVMAVVAVGLVGAWLAAVFRAARQPASTPPRPGGDSTGHGTRLGADPPSQRVPAARDMGSPPSGAQ